MARLGHGRGTVLVYLPDVLFVLDRVARQQMAEASAGKTEGEN